VQGVCKFYLHDRRFGFIQLENERDEPLGEPFEFFFNGAEILGDKVPIKGDDVSFWLDVDRNRGNLIATEVEVTLKP
jgi:hypothetical protein